MSPAITSSLVRPLPAVPPIAVRLRPARAGAHQLHSIATAAKRSTRCSEAPVTPAKVLGDGTKRVLVAASLSLGLLLPYYHPPGATAAQDPEACVKKCTKECNKIAPGSPGYCQETCEDECSFMAAEGAAKEEAEGKEMVTNLGFLGDDYVGNPLDNTLKQLFAGGKTGPTK